MFTIYQLAYFLLNELEKEIIKYKSKLVVITGDFFLSDSQITKEFSNSMGLVLYQ
jgi:hypothetical protein